MSLLDRLVKEDTPIILLDDALLTEEERIQIAYGKNMRLNSRDKEHLSNICSYKGENYYFKVEDETSLYFYEVIDELLGSYLASKIKLDTVKYKIGYKDERLGLASLDFRDYSKYEYLFPHMILPEYYECTSKDTNLEILKSQTVSKRNEDKLFLQLIKMFALDIYMLQIDRNGKNIQFKRDIKTGELLLAPTYDYGRCALRDIGNLSYINYIRCFNKPEYKSMLKEYPILGDIINQLIETNMVPVINKIFKDYKLDTESYMYEEIIDYYYKKQKERKEDIKKYVL